MISDERLAHFLTPSSQTRGPTMQECIDMATEITALRAHNSDSAEPVAWIIEEKSFGWKERIVTDHPEEGSRIRNIRPLYLASPPAKEVEITDEMVDRAAKLISPWAFDIPELLLEERFKGAGPWPEGDFYVWDNRHAGITNPDGDNSYPWRKMASIEDAQRAAERLNSQPLAPYLKEQARSKEIAIAVLAALKNRTPDDEAST